MHDDRSLSVSLSRRQFSGTGRRRELLEGPIRARRLHLSSYFVIHGSCVSIGGVAVSIAGPSGAGKSTLATLLCQRGATLVSDGMTPVHPETLELAPGPPRTKLDDASLHLLGRDPLAYPLVHSNSKKRYYPLPSADQVTQVRPPSASGTLPAVQSGPTSARLRLVLLVEDAPEMGILPIQGAQATIGLIRNVYCSQFLRADLAATLLERAAAIVQQGVQIKVLRRAKDPSRLSQIADMIEEAAYRART